MHFEVGMIMPSTVGIGVVMAHKRRPYKNGDWIVWIARIIKRLTAI